VHLLHSLRSRRSAPAVASSAAALVAAAVVALPGGTARAATDLVTNPSFDNGVIAPWSAYGVTSTTVQSDAVQTDALCADIPAGTTNPWDAAIQLENVPVVNAGGYEFSFRARAAKDATITTAFQQGAPGYERIAGGNPALTSQWQSFTYSGTAGKDGTGSVVFQGGGQGANTVCIDDVHLLSGVQPPPYVPDTGPRVRVNQVGYLPFGPKGATLVTDATTPLPWQLRNAAGSVVASGTTTPRGTDRTSGQNVATIDFSSWTAPGTGYTLSTDGETSRPFAVSATIYQQLRRDSKTFFYTQRSGTPIRDSLVPGYGRAAGHVGVAPNQGDTAVGCQQPVAWLDGWTCDPAFRTDVTGGWYDAGDHGKYVVNGGIATAQLLGEYERNQRADDADRRALADVTLRIPEAGNKVPDILDEARWELTWMLKMQVPANTTVTGLTPYAGMAFLKVQDDSWTGLPLAPANDPKVRELHRPSTAATLNLAAVAAQGARVFAPYDKAFSRRLLSAARTAYTAAKAHPAVYSPEADGNSGGGAYADGNVIDEFYWAAAELYITTGKAEYRTDLLASPQHTADVFSVNGFSWNTLAPLARMDLATTRNGLPKAERDRIRASVVAGADKILALADQQPYGQPYAPADGRFDWGSNSNLLNNLQVLATAYDLTEAAKYRRAVLVGMDYLLGRNALNHSYVTGYGTVFSQNQHSRMYAHQLDPSLPHPPVGSIAGGPNSSIQDPVAQSKLKGCTGQFCYLDDIGSWSTNEIAINWNSALSWVSSFVADLGNGKG
jgi:endoglucanase